MKLIYNPSNMLNLSQLIDCYEVPQKFKSQLASAHSYVYKIISEVFIQSNLKKVEWTKAINTITYIVFKGDHFPIRWNRFYPIDNLPDIDDDELKSVLGKYYLTPTGICWDVTPVKLPEETIDRINEAVENVKKHNESTSSPDNANHSVVLSNTNRPLANVKRNPNKLEVQKTDQVDLTSANKLTSIDDVLLDPGFPYVPCVDFNDIWYIGKDDWGEEYGIPKSLPIIPERQSDVTATTDVSRMVDSDFMKLYPNHIMKLRAPRMYQHYEDYYELDYDDDLGVIFPIRGFDRDQIVDNIIKYPDIINIGLGRVGKRKQFPGDTSPQTIWEAFQTRIEIDGELKLVTQDLWNESPELSKLPPNRAFQQEYIVRKYLLEREYGKQYIKEPFGEIHPFTTLFMPPEQYIKRGYTDVVGMAKACVKGRVHYFRSRKDFLTIYSC